MSRTKSSMAEYNISSTDLFILWISSINNTSPSARFVSIDARSDGLSMAGPLVTLKFTPSSFAIIVDKVVFPKPGGP